VDNKQYLEDIFDSSKFNTTSTDYHLNAMIINNSTITLTVTDRNIAAFSVNNEIYTLLATKYGIEAEKDNTWVNLYYQMTDVTENAFIALIISISIAGLLLITVVLWHFSTRRYDQYIGSLQKIFTIYMYLKLLLCLLVVYYVKLSLENATIDNPGDTILKIYVQTVVATIQSVLKTILWFIILIIAFVT
jgi:hypothetical protein